MKQAAEALRITRSAVPYVTKLPSGASRNGWIELKRRGFHYGYIQCEPRGSESRTALRLFKASQPVFLPGMCSEFIQIERRSISRTVAEFDRLREGADFQEMIQNRLAGNPRFVAAGATRDLGDGREIEKVFVHLKDGAQRRVVARDLYAKLSWISRDPRDSSLRIRFSFGSERLLDWLHKPARAPHADAYAEAAYPECRAIADHKKLLALASRVTGRRIRVSERIIYNNAPGGGAVFHHDGEPRQLGVIYAQLAGTTAWLALPKRILAEIVASILRRPPAAVLRALDSPDDPAIERMLNGSKALVQRIAAQGYVYYLNAGDVLLLPSNGPDDVAWHSVFATGAHPSLSLSFAVFPK